MKSIKKNYIYNLIYQIFAILTPFLTTPYISRTLGATKIGEYSYGLSIVTYFALLGTLGITTYAQIEIAKVRDNEELKEKIIADLFVIKSVTMLIAIVIYALFIFIYPSSHKVLIVLIFYLFSQLNDASWILQGLERFQELVIRNMLVKIASIILIFTFIKAPSDLYIYTLIMQGSVFVGNFLLWPSVFNYIRLANLKKNFNSKNIKLHLKNSLVYFIPTMATTVYTVLDKSMIGWLTNSYTQNGFYEQSHKIEQILLTVITSLGTVTLPRMTYLNEKNDTKSVNSLMKKTISFVLLLAFPMCFGLIGVSKNLIPIFLGEGYQECIPIVNVFSTLLIIVGLDNIIGRQCLMATNNQKQFNIGVIAGAITNVIINIRLIPSYGAFGAAIGSVCAEVIILIIFIYASRKYLKIDILNSVLKYILASSIMFVCITIIARTIAAGICSLMIQIIIGIFVYFSILIIIKEEIVINLLKQTLKKVIKR